jgi:hypothetical protein
MATAATWGDWNVPDVRCVTSDTTRIIATPKLGIGGGVCGVGFDTSANTPKNLMKALWTGEK